MRAIRRAVGIVRVVRGNSADVEHKPSVGCHDDAIVARLPSVYFMNATNRVRQGAHAGITVLRSVKKYACTRDSDLFLRIPTKVGMVAIICMDVRAL